MAVHLLLLLKLYQFLQPFYVKGKGSNRPLIDGGAMIGAIRYEVEGV